MKKIAALVGAGALVLTLVVPAMANPPGGGGGGNPPSTGGVDLTNWASVTNIVSARANTGFNSVSGMCLWRGKIWTGDAAAVAGTQTLVNQNIVDCKDCGGSTKISNTAYVTNNVSASANTGFNSVGKLSWRVGSATIGSGNAYAEAGAYTVVNTNVVGE